MADGDRGDPPATAAELALFVTLIGRWAEAEQLTNPLVAHVEFVPAERRWLIRLRGEDKAVITVWLTLGERTLHYETYFMPAPEEQVARCYEYLLRLNSRLYGMRFSIGPEDAVYLTGQVPLRALDIEELDHIVGASYAYCEQYFRAALGIGFASRLAGPAPPGS